MSDTQTSGKQTQEQLASDAAGSMLEAHTLSKDPCFAYLSAEKREVTAQIQSKAINIKKEAAIVDETNIKMIQGTKEENPDIEAMKVQLETQATSTKKVSKIADEIGLKQSNMLQCKRSTLHIMQLSSVH